MWKNSTFGGGGSGGGGGGGGGGLDQSIKKLIFLWI